MTGGVLPSRRRMGRIRGFLMGGLSVTLGFVALRFLITPLRMKVITTILTPEDYGLVTLLSMTAHGLGLIVSVGGFELLLRRLPNLDIVGRRSVFHAVLVLSTAGGLVISLLLAGLWNHVDWLGSLSARLSVGAAVVLFLLFLHVQQRIYYLLGSHDHFRSRALQLMWSDLWFLPVFAGMAIITWNAETVVWTWSAWLVLILVCTWRWVPMGAFVSSGPISVSLRATFWRSVPILPVLVGDWVFRLTGHYALLIHWDAATMAFYALAMNVALTGQVAGVPLIDLCCVDLSKAMGQASVNQGLVPNPVEMKIVSRGVRHILAVSAPVMLVLLYMPADIIDFLAGSAFRDAAGLLPWAALLPLLMLFNLLLARMLMLLGRSFWVAFGSILGAVTSLILCSIMVPSFGSRGALLSITCAAALVDILYAFEIRAWRWLDIPSIRWPGLLIGGLILVSVFAHIRLIPGAAFTRLAVAGFLSLLVLWGTGCVRRQDFGSKYQHEPVKAG